MKKILLLFGIILVFSCVNITQNKDYKHRFTSAKIEPILEKSISIRALKVTPDHIFFAGSEGKFGYLNSADHSLAYMGQIEYRGTNPEFRAVAMNETCAFILSAGNPGLLYRVNYFGKRELLYRELGKNVFYDAMAFWNDQEGLAIGDPTSKCMSVLITRDGGDSWNKIPCDKLPKSKEGEAAFAASNTNISIDGKNAWFISGGKHARIYHSPDMGKTWEAKKLPVIQGKQSTGPYSLDFYNESLGFMIGGDYIEPKKNKANKATSSDGGKTWNLTATNEQPGYKSCVKFVPNSNGEELVVMGFTGISYSSDSGNSWTKLSDEGFYTFEFMNDYTAIAAGKNKISKITFKEKMDNKEQ